MAHEKPLAPSPTAAAAAALAAQGAEAAAAASASASSASGGGAAQPSAAPSQPQSPPQGGEAEESDGLGAFYLMLCAATFCRPPNVEAGRHADFGNARARLRVRFGGIDL